MRSRLQAPTHLPCASVLVLVQFSKPLQCCSNLSRMCPTYGQAASWAVICVLPPLATSLVRWLGSDQQTCSSGLRAGVHKHLQGSLSKAHPSLQALSSSLGLPFFSLLPSILPGSRPKPQGLTLLFGESQLGDKEENSPSSEF